MYILRVVPITQTTTAEMLSYFSAKPVRAGMIVTVPLRKQEIKALVITTEKVTNIKSQIKDAQYQLRNIIDIHSGEIFSPELLSTIHQLKSFYVTSTGRMLDIIVPRIITKNPEQFIRPLREHSTKKNIQTRTQLLQQPFYDRIGYYKTLLREKFFEGNSLHIICPTQESTLRLAAHLEKNNPGKIFVFHSGMTKKTLQTQLAALYSYTEASCVISTAGFLDVYQHNIDTFIIEETSSEYYTTVTQPHIDYTIVLREYINNHAYHSIWADSMIRPEIFVWHHQGNAECIEPFTKNILEKQNLEIIEHHQRNPKLQNDHERIKEIVDESRDDLFFNTIIEKEIRQAIKTKKNIFILVPRKSLAPNIICRDCGNIARSPESGFPYSLYLKNKERVFICQRTGETIPAFDTCQFCNSWKLVSYGLGTEMIQEYFSRHFPQIESFIIDGTHAKTKKYINEVQTIFTNPKKSTVIIATQKGIPLFVHHDITIITGLDVFFSRMNYALAPLLVKRIIDLKEKSTRTIIQTRNVIQKVLPILEHGMYSSFIDDELQQRKQYAYPPYVTLIKIVHTVPRTRAKQEYQSIVKYYHAYNPEILTQPAPKNCILIIILLTLPLSDWNTEFQNPILQRQLYALERSIQVTINPTDLY